MRKDILATVLRSEDGEAQVFYHGTPFAFDEFSYDFIGKGNDQYGSGFYFTSCPEDANAYTSSNAISPDECAGNILPVVLSFVCPLRIEIEGSKSVSSGRAMRPNKVKQMILLSPKMEDSLSGWGELKHEGLPVVLNRASESYSHFENLLEQLNAISNDFFSGNEGVFLSHLYEVSGYDGVIIDFKDASDGVTRCVAWSPEKIIPLYSQDAQNLPCAKNLIFQEDNLGLPSLSSAPK